MDWQVHLPGSRVKFPCVGVFNFGPSPFNSWIRPWGCCMQFNFPILIHAPRSLNFTKLLKQKHIVKYTSLIFGQESSENKTAKIHCWPGKNEAAPVLTGWQHPASSILCFFELCLFLAPPTLNFWSIWMRNRKLNCNGLTGKKRRSKSHCTTDYTTLIRPALITFVIVFAYLLLKYSK